MKTIYILTLFLYIYENYLHYNIILEINICANSNTMLYFIYVYI